MPFDPVNTPPFYPCMMGTLKNEWDYIFLESIRALVPDNSLLGTHKVTIRGNDTFFGQNESEFRHKVEYCQRIDIE